ncbi:glutathione S-transferase family protein [Sulfitobacter alexandrii]|nr:glutathione S-transferase C-terminal domain-containing protein [Sulfitobacter alexandrii]
MKLYYAPGACSIGTHFLMEEMGLTYDTGRLDLKQGDQLKPAYLDVNPKAKVPALVRDDGSLLTEFVAIAFWLGRTYPEKGMIPEGMEAEVRTLEMLDYAVATIHMQGFSRLFRPAKFARSEAEHDWVREQGRAVVDKAFGIVSERLGSSDFIMGDRLTLADAALFYVLFWGVDRVKLDVPENLAAYYARLRARPSAQKVFADEGIQFS